MKRVLEIEKEYKCSAKNAIEKFFKLHPELEYWKEEFEYMESNGKDFESDNHYGDSSYNKDWTYALHFDDDGNRTYICIIERA